MLDGRRYVENYASSCHFYGQEWKGAFSYEFLSGSTVAMVRLWPQASRLGGPHHHQVVQTEANLGMRLTIVGFQVCFPAFGEATSVFSAAFTSMREARTHRLHISILFHLRLSSCQSFVQLSRAPRS